ncbi:Disintegrin and metalloproteinase domain-containing protein B [Saitozyma sp. JCM 24511]|nr:Disintegrin and metalloproteinase domain-containing protein B [Saitozyma sp. JCM 24511]
MVLRTILLVGLLGLLVPAEGVYHANVSDTILLTLSLPELLPFEASLLLRPTEHLFHPDAKETSDGVQVGKLNRADWRLFTGDVVHPKWVDRIMAEETFGHGVTSGNGRMGSANIMVHYPGGDGVDPVFEGSFVIDGVTYHVLTRDKYLRLRKPGDVEVEDFGDMVVFRDIDMFDDAPVTSTHTCSHDSLPHNNNMSHPIWLNRHAEVFTPFPPYGGDLDEINQHDMWKRDDTGGMTGSSNFINSINSTSGCPSTTQIVYMGVALDCNYVATYGSSDAARSQVLNDWNQISALYKSTFNISLGIIELTVMNGSCPSTAVSGQEWNVGCDKNLTLDQRLSDFSQWRGSKGDDGVGLWHLMSACPTDSEVGVAWLGTLCQQSATQQSTSYVSGTGISTATKTEWSLVAHEIGHGFGAIHDCTGGCSLSGQCCPLTQSTCDAGGSFIMNPTTSSTEIKFSGCTLGNICSNIGTRAISSSCIQSPKTDVTVISLQQCGNGIVEAGEQCDPGSNSTSACCDPSTCKFRSGAVCDPSNSACCTSSCQYASSGTVCRAAVDAQCDYAEVCSGNNATCPADKTAPDGQSCGSSGEACASGTCTSLNLQCQSAGASMNLTTACGQRDDTSCVVTCKSPNVTNQCVVLQTPLVDGSPCGYGGHCYNQTCQAGSWEATFDSWYTSNLQISIPVTIVVGLIVSTGTGSLSASP